MLYLALLFYGNLQVVRILVSHPSIDVNLSYRGGMTALHWAIVEHTKSLVLLLECSRIDVNKKGSPGGWQSPLYQAVRFNSLHAVKLLLAHKDINISLLN
jgi:ankyrin repeat protein